MAADADPAFAHLIEGESVRVSVPEQDTCQPHDAIIDIEDVCEQQKPTGRRIAKPTARRTIQKDTYYADTGYKHLTPYTRNMLHDYLRNHTPPDFTSYNDIKSSLKAYCGRNKLDNMFSLSFTISHFLSKIG